MINHAALSHSVSVWWKLPFCCSPPLRRKPAVFTEPSHHFHSASLCLATQLTTYRVRVTCGPSVYFLPGFASLASMARFKRSAANSRPISTRCRPFKRDGHRSPQFHPRYLLPLSRSASLSPPAAVCRSPRASDLHLKGLWEFLCIKGTHTFTGNHCAPCGVSCTEGEWKKEEERRSAAAWFCRLSCRPHLRHIERLSSVWPLIYTSYIYI